VRSAAKPHPRKRIRNLFAGMFTCPDCASVLHVAAQGYGIVCITVEHSATCPAEWLHHAARRAARAKRHVS
jgi:hypothetical protein